VNIKRVRRLWVEMGLQQKWRKPKKEKREGRLEGLKRAERMNQGWGCDIIEDRMESGSKLRMLTVTDEYTRESLAIRVERRMPSWKVRETLEELAAERGVPEYVRSDNGKEFVAKAVGEWLRKSGSETIYIAPGHPWENPFAESFHATMRRECLRRELFGSLREAEEIVEAWREEYNWERPHSALGGQTPGEFARRLRRRKKH
jgi:transposase InsO family protein